MPHFLDEAGLIHKGSMGDVVMFEDARHPGLTMSARSADLNSAASARALADQKIQAHLSKGGPSLDAIKARLGIPAAAQSTVRSASSIATQSIVRQKQVQAAASEGLFKPSTSVFNFLYTQGVGAATVPRDLKDERLLLRVLSSERPLTKASYRRLSKMAAASNSPYANAVTSPTFLNEVQALAGKPTVEIGPIAMNKGELRDAYQKARSASRWSKETGVHPIALRPENAFSEEVGRILLNHEEIHAAHYTEPGHNFWKQAESEARNLRASIGRSLSNPDMARFVKQSGGNKDLITRHYELQIASRPEEGKFIRSTETIAHHFEADPNFLSRAEASGVRTRRAASEQFKQRVQLATTPPIPASQVAHQVAHTGHMAPTRVAQIPGLPEKGIMARMRKILTSFGSPWQGLDAEPFVFRTSPDLSSGKADGFVTDVYHKTPKGEDWVGHVAFGPVAGDTRTASVRASMLAQDFRGKGLGQTLYLETMEAASNEGFTYFMSDATGSVSESAQKMWSRLEPEVGAIRSTLKGKPSWKVDLVKNRGIMRAARTKAGAGRVAEAIPRLMKGL